MENLGTVDVLLITVTEVEAQAVIDLVEEKFNQKCVPIFDKVNVYYDIGVIGGAKTAMLRSQMGSGGPGGAALTVADAIQALSPSVVIMVGIAFGVNPRKQKIGDILISQQVLDYTPQRIGTGQDGEQTITARGDKASASPMLIQRFQYGQLRWQGPKVEFGLILSGGVLVDNIDYRDQLRKLAPEAIGGEMEGAGLYSAAYRQQTHWILVKAICDWADGKKSRNKKKRQAQAAQNAAAFTIHLLEQGGFSKNTLYKKDADKLETEKEDLEAIKDKLATHLQRQIAKEKNSKKYIPDIFVEVAKVKDQARFFAHPTMFFQKVLDKVEQLNFSDVNRVLQKLSLQSIQLNWQYSLSTKETIDVIYEYTNSLHEALSQIQDALYPYHSPSSSTSKPIDVPPNKRYVYKDMKYYLEGITSSVVWDIKDLLKDLELMPSRILFIISGAGQGKTNFVCDFADRVLVKRDIPCAFFTGREFNYVVPERIGEYFVKSIFSDRVNGLDDALNSLSKLAIRANVPVVIIIDGINEHKNIQAFAHHLEKFVEKVLEYKHIKLILTCRSEYFEERFSNFKQSSFAKEIQFIDNLERHMSKVHKGQLVRGYFHFFKLRYSYISKHAFEILERDTLLLRMFCEAYGGENAHDTIQLPQIVDIYREKVFRKYYERKIESATEYDEDSLRINVRSGEKFRQVLDYIIKLMVQREQYANIPIADLPIDYDHSLGILLGEDVIVRKDLMNVDNAFSDRAEVISFTFDEFRDFLLAKYLVYTVFRQDQQKFEEVVDRTVAPKSAVAEGVRTYLFFASKRSDERDILKVIGEKEWYREIFIKSIFSVEEEFITQDDLNEIKLRFYENERNASWIIRMLVWRWRTSWYSQLNIYLLFEIFNELNDDTYSRLVSPGVSGRRIYGFDGYPSWNIEQITSELSKELDSGDLLETTDFINLMELLIFFFPIWGRETYSSPAFQTFSKFAKLKPDAAILLLKKHTRIVHLGVRTQVWRMLTLVAKSNEIPIDLIEETCQVLLEIAENEPHNWDLLAREVVRFLEVCAEKKQIWYLDPVVEQMKRYTLTPYYYEQINDTGT